MPSTRVSLRSSVLLLAWMLALPAPAWAREQLVVEGESAPNGIFDPSVEFDPNTGDGWLAYSAVSGSRPPWGPFVETHLARSPDGGRTWVLEQEILASEPGQILLDGLPVDGVWNHEVPTLVYDPGDSAAPWKLVAHRIFRRTDGDPADDVNVPSHSWLVLYTAAEPNGTWTGPVLTLASGPLPPPPFGVDVAINDLDASLLGLAVYSEPGLFELGGVLYLVVTGLDPLGTGRIVLLVSPDHGASWDYRATPLDPSDAAALGSLDFDGSSLVAQQGRYFLLASPSTPTVPRNGALLFEFADLPAGSLIRVAGVPEIQRIIPLDPNVSTAFGGQADFHELATHGGILTNQLNLDEPPAIFQIQETDVWPVPEPAAGSGAAAALLALLGLGRPAGARAGMRSRSLADARRSRSRSGSRPGRAGPQPESCRGGPNTASKSGVTYQFCVGTSRRHFCTTRISVS